MENWLDMKGSRTRKRKRAIGQNSRLKHLQDILTPVIPRPPAPRKTPESSPPRLVYAKRDGKYLPAITIGSPVVPTVLLFLNDQQKLKAPQSVELFAEPPEGAPCEFPEQYDLQFLTEEQQDAVFGLENDDDDCSNQQGVGKPENELFYADWIRLKTNRKRSLVPATLVHPADTTIPSTFDSIQLMAEHFQQSFVDRTQRMVTSSVSGRR